MDDKMSADQGSPKSDEERALSRRSALKKAAAAAGVAGAVWSAPRVEGLSIVPDYAFAGTFVGTILITRHQQDCSGGSSANCWGNCTTNGPFVSPYDCHTPWTVSVPVAANGSGGGPWGPGSGGAFTWNRPTVNQTANNSFNIDWRGSGDNTFSPTNWPVGGQGEALFNFANMPPPFNMCAVTALRLHLDDGTNLNAPTPRVFFSNDATNKQANATFRTPGSISRQANDVHITIQCT